MEGKGIGRKVIDKMYQTYSSELAGKNFAYDGEKSLFTVGSLPQNNFEFTVVLEESSARYVISSFFCFTDFVVGLMPRSLSLLLVCSFLQGDWREPGSW